MRRLLLLAALSLSYPAHADGYRDGYSRFGSVYDRIEMDGGTPAICEALCAEDAMCLSWSWSRPGLQGPDAQCALLAAAPTPQRRPGHVTGLSPALRARLDAASERAPTAREIEALRATLAQPYRQ